jgi:cytosine/adenosine deaminase-related metal-dependent hydrolase
VIVYTADWILPIAQAPIASGWVAVEAGRVVEVGSGPRRDAVHLGRVALLPALVNAHTHLELSYLRDAVPSARSFLEWVRNLLAVRRTQPNPEAPDILAAARAGIHEAHVSGTGVVGDVSNTLATVPLLLERGMPARVFYELVGFNTADPVGQVRAARALVSTRAGAGSDLRVCLAPHAPYSVSPRLFSAIHDDLAEHPGDVSSVHLSESPEEEEFIRLGTGGWRELLVTLGAWNDEWRAPGVSPVTYLADSGFLDARVLVVHGAQCSIEDVRRLRAIGTTVVACPRSNQYVGVGDPPLEAFYATGVSVAFGTDSLASVPDLNMFQELAAARRLAPGMPARTLIESATLVGARALGFGDGFGSIEAGKRAALIAVDLPARVGDVEEYLVSGIAPEMIQWVQSSSLATRTVAPSHPGT